MGFGMIPKKRIRNGLWKFKLSSNQKAEGKRHCLPSAFFLLTLRLPIRLPCRLHSSSKTPFLAPQKDGEARIPASTL